MTTRRNATFLCGLLGSIGVCACETSPSAKPIVQVSETSPPPAEAKVGKPKPPTAAPIQGSSAQPPTLPASQEPEPEEMTKLCKVLCKQTESLNCGPMASCVQGCSKSFGLPTCQGEVAKFISCLIKQPMSSWRCGPGGAPSLKEGICGAEQDGIVICLKAQLDATSQPPPSATHR